MRVTTALGAFSLLAGCTATANTYPVNQAAFDAGAIKIEFVRNGTSRGPVTATLVDGSVLKGEYAVTDDGTFETMIGRFGAVSAFSESGGRPVEADATDGKETLECALRVDLGGDGGGACQLQPSGAVYRVTF